MVADADVLIENFKVGGLAKYGLDYASLSTINPRLVYCSITGFGQDGPYASRAGYDFIIQGMSGIMDLTGEPDGAPQKVGVAFADIMTGLYSVIAIQAALAQREKTGRGQQIDMALLDTMVGVLANQAMNFFVSGQTHPASAMPISTSRPMRCFRRATAGSSSRWAMTGNSCASAMRWGWIASRPIRASPPMPGGSNIASRCSRRSGRRPRGRSAMRCSRRWRRSACRPGRSITSPRPLPTRR